MTLEDLPLARAVVDRAAHRRGDDAWLATAWADPRTRVLVVADAAVLLESRDPPRAALLPPADAPTGERFFLGVSPDGAAYFAVAATLPADDARAGGLREVGALLDAQQAGLVVHAVALANWHATHPHCARCGARTEAAYAGHVRRCPRDGSEHFPRTDPAVIMAVVDADERLLLGRQQRWPPRRFSTLAGFVEPGESLEQAVRREVAEEVGVDVGALRYLGSQPWPFPSSLMLAFVASARTTVLRVDGDEIAEARWVSRAQLASAVGSGELLLPPPTSIARRLIEHWHGGPLQPPAG